MNQPHERKPSPAKAAVAQQKPRDSSGKFLSGAELQNYRMMQQQAQYSAEQAKLASLFGRQVSTPTQQYAQPQQQQQDPEREKWDYLLGKKRR